MSSRMATEASFTMQAVDLCYEMGVQQLQTGQHDMAVKWLRRATDFLQSCDNVVADGDWSELKLNVLHAHGQAQCQMVWPSS
jgi:Meiosis protein SPO22/ZIP4 like